MKKRLRKNGLLNYIVKIIILLWSQAFLMEVNKRQEFLILEQLYFSINNTLRVERTLSFR